MYMMMNLHDACLNIDGELTAVDDALAGLLCRQDVDVLTAQDVKDLNAAIDLIGHVQDRLMKKAHRCRCSAVLTAMSMFVPTATAPTALNAIAR